jgi:uncharacterized protein YneF (UPF0154 family)
LFCPDFGLLGAAWLVGVALAVAVAVSAGVMLGVDLRSGMFISMPIIKSSLSRQLPSINFSGLVP